MGIIGVGPHGWAQGAEPPVLRRFLFPTATAPQAGAGAGVVAISGDLVAVGARDDQALGNAAGVVKIYHAASGDLLHVLGPGVAQQSDEFGAAVAISGSRVIVGAPGRGFDVGANETVGIAHVFDLESATPTIPVTTLSGPLSSTPYDAFGASVAISGTRVAVGNPGRFSYGPGVVYLYDLADPAPAVPTHTFSDASPSNGDKFGQSVAIANTRVVVGAPYARTNDVVTGRVHVFDLTSAVPTDAVQTFPGPGEGAIEFGGSVSLAGSLVMVGAPYRDVAATDAGSVFVFDMAAAMPSEPVLTLESPFAQAQGHFGIDLAAEGTRLVVGASGEDTPAAEAGGAYVYDLSGPTPSTPVAVLRKAIPGSGDNLGASVACAGSRIVLGAPGDDTSADNAGGALVFDLGGPTPESPIRTLAHSGPPAGDNFGIGIAISGARLAVGAYGDDTGANDSGSVSVFDLTQGSSPSLIAVLPNPSPASEDFFGLDVAISGSRVVVGAGGDDTAGTDAGIAYLFDLAGPAPSVPILTLTEPVPRQRRRFGTAVAMAGNRIAVGAPVFSAGSFPTVYVYDLASMTPSVPVATLLNFQFNSQFGRSLAMSGSRLVVGAYLASGGGQVFVYDLSRANPTSPIAILNDPTPASSTDFFGWAVAIDGNRIVVGAFLNDGGTEESLDAGVAYVYDLAGSSPSQPTLTLPVPSPAYYDGFGFAVAISGTRVAVGAIRKDIGARDAGRVYLFDLASATPTVPIATLDTPNPSLGGWFGARVAISGATVAVGAPSENVTGGYRGAAYVFGHADSDNDGLPDAWELDQWNMIFGHDAASDLDYDGLTELEELGYGLDPTLPDSALRPIPVVEGGYLTITITKRDGVAYEVESAGTLVPGQLDSFSTTTTTVLIDHGTTLKVRDNVPIGAVPARFLRVKVLAVP